MFAFHLNENIDDSSRNHKFIEKSVDLSAIRVRPYIPRSLLHSLCKACPDLRMRIKTI